MSRTYEITKNDYWVMIDSNYGIDYFPLDMLYCPHKIPVGKIILENDHPRIFFSLCRSIKEWVQISGVWSIELIQGYGVRWTMPGFLDCGDWNVFRTEEEVNRFIEDLEDAEN